MILSIQTFSLYNNWLKLTNTVSLSLAKRSSKLCECSYLIRAPKETQVHIHFIQITNIDWASSVLQPCFLGHSKCFTDEYLITSSLGQKIIFLAFADSHILTHSMFDSKLLPWYMTFFLFSLKSSLPSSNKLAPPHYWPSCEQNR